MERTVRQIIEYLMLSDDDIVLRGFDQLGLADNAYEYIAVTSETETVNDSKSLEHFEHTDHRVADWENRMVNGVSTDSRKIQPGQLFVPLMGEHTDGHDYRYMAYEHGGFVSLWHKHTVVPEIPGIYLLVDDTLDSLQLLAHQYRKSLPIKVIGITGSNGKTTTKDFLVSILGQQHRVCGTKGNLNNHIGVPLTLLSAREDDQYAVIEMGMNHFGEIKRLTEIAEPDIGIITNVGESHIEHFGTRDAISRAKFELVDTMKSGVVIINFDDMLLRRRVEELSAGVSVVSPASDNNHNRIVGYAIHTACDVGAVGNLPQQIVHNVVTDDIYPGQILTYHGAIISRKKTIRSTSVLRILNRSIQQSADFTITTPGPHTIYNALAAIVVAKECGVPDFVIQKGLDQVQVTPMRMEITQIGSSYIINDAYNASPTSMKAVITYLSDIEEPYKKVVLLGDMMELGDMAETYHYEIGQCLLDNSIDRVFAYGENARFYIKPFIEKDLDHTVDYFAFGQEEELVRALKQQIEQGCILVVKGSRSMKLEQFIHRIKAGEDES